MNYERIYSSLIERARNRSLTGYIERHHIIPRCMGGKDENNIVKLTAREHYVAHILLARIHKHPGLIHAAFRMGRKSSRIYEWLRIENSKSVKQRFSNKIQYHDTDGNMYFIEKDDKVPRDLIKGRFKSPVWKNDVSRSEQSKIQWRKTHEKVAIENGFESLSEFESFLSVERLTISQKELCDRYNITKTVLRRIYINAGMNPSDRIYRSK